MSKPPKKPKGRPATDERGNATWKWVGESGKEVGTDLIKALGEGLSLESPPQKVNVDPYNQSTAQSQEKTKARSLDDMRRLNDEMKREHEELVKSLRQRTPSKRASHRTRGLRLWCGDRELRVDDRYRRITIGRGEENDVVVIHERVSRLHTRIELSRNQFVLVDQSTNGTYVQSAAGEPTFIRRDSLPLKGQGVIGIGIRPEQDSPHTIRFSCEEI